MKKIKKKAIEQREKLKELIRVTDIRIIDTNIPRVKSLLGRVIEFNTNITQSLSEIGIYIERIEEEIAVKRDCEKKLRKLAHRIPTTKMKGGVQ